jgi:transglutaminase-like putative cysteine protease
MQTPTARQWDWISAGLLFLMLQMPAARLVTTDWAPFLYWTETMSGVGVLLGLALGASKFRGRTAALLALAYAATILPWQLSMYFKDKLLIDRLRGVISTLGESFQQFAQRQPVKDPLFFLLWVCLAFWLIGVFAGYGMARHRRLLITIVVSGAAIVIIQAYGNYQPRGSWWLAVFVLLAALLAGRIHFMERRAGWAVTRVFVSEDSGGNLLAGLLMTAALAILAAWWIPAVPGSVERAAQIWNQYVEPIRERLSNAVTSLSGPYGQPGDNFYGGVLPLGRTAATGDQVVLRVQVLESPGVNLRYYWRGRVYSDYANGSWSASPPARILFQADGQDLVVPDAAGRVEGLFRLTSEFQRQSLIYGPAPAVWLDRSAEVSAVRASQGAYDVFSWVARLPLAQGSSYQVRSTLRNPTVIELRAAGELYPAWVTSGYMGVPDRHRQRFAELAEEITVGQDAAYDKAVAITNYLRLNISYSGRVPGIPEGQDPVAWVLFDHKQGYCNYYASAEVLLLRSIGIPARLAVGFARGEFIEGAYTVYRRDAHAWPEVYFPGIGWVEFEPTANQAPLARPSGAQAAGSSGPVTPGRGTGDEEISQFPEQVELAPPSPPIPFRLTAAGRALYTGVPILLALGALALAYRLRIWSRLPAYVTHGIEVGGGRVPTWLRQWEGWFKLQPVERLFAVVGWTLRLLGKPQAVSATPAAQAAALSSLVPSAAKHVDILRAQLETGLYTNREADLAKSRRASLMVFLHGLRAGGGALLKTLDRRAVYSGTDFPHRSRGTR